MKKKLLVLGGTRSTLDIVKTAKEMGYEVIVTDNLQGGEAKDMADYSVQISTTDYKSLKSFIQEHQISGVFTGASEFNTYNMICLCQMLDLPVYATKEQWNVCSNKDKFKALCKKYNVSVVPAYTVDDKQLEICAEKIKYPVIIKPVDGNSGVGISICHNSTEFAHGYYNGCMHSKSNNVIIEKYMHCKNLEAYYIIQNGKVSLMSLSDRLTRDDQDGSPVPIAFFHPSLYIKEYIEKVNDKVCHMFEAFGLKQGVLFLEAFYDGSNFYFYEMGYRLNGTMEYKFVDYFYDYNPLNFMIQYAVDGIFGDHNVVEHSFRIFDGYACELSPLLKKGIICGIKGLDEIKKDDSIIFVHQLHDLEDVIEATGTLHQNFARIHIVSKDCHELVKKIKWVLSTLHVYDVNGEEMLLPYKQEEIEHYERFKG